MISSAIREFTRFLDTVETMIYNITSGTNIFQVPMCKKCGSLLVAAEDTCLECYTGKKCNRRLDSDNWR